VKPLGILGPIVLLFLAGCGEPPVGTVWGKVTYTKYAVIQKDGSYEAVGVRVGETTVLVTSVPTPEGDMTDTFDSEIIAKRQAAAVKAARDAGWFPIPTEFGDVQKSRLRYSVQKGENQYNIDLR
jgi:hypothetical protein